MIEMKIKVNEKDLHALLGAIGRMRRSLGENEHYLLRRSAEQFANELRRNITSQKYDFPDLSESWASRKKRLGTSGFWLYMGRVLKNIYVTRLTKNNYKVAIRSVSYTTGNPKLYAPIVESGQKGGHPRPLFAWTYRDFKTKWNRNCIARFHQIRNSFLR